jgi:hypothetical protein
MRLLRSVVVLVCVVAGSPAVASFLDAVPAEPLDPSVPSIRAVTGWDWGEDISDPEQAASYARLLAEKAPSRVRLVEYARSLEGRPLHLVVVTSAENLARVERLRGDMARLADPRAISAAEADRLIASLPAVVWIACSVHGDEASGGDAGLALAYVLAAGGSPEVKAVLERTIVIVDPVQNPDGRARFVLASRQARSPKPDPEPASAEHVQPWPGGRLSHDLFDLNRDWFALTHPETRGRVAAMLEWHPHLVADLHEMGSDMGYFFAPPAQPLNPLVTPEQSALWDLMGKANAEAFDRRGWRYWTREVFDAFYPGYGESWPFFSGALGMTYEQASTRGRVVRLRNERTLSYADAVQHHLVSSFTTCWTAATNRERFLRSWYRYRQAAVDEGGRGAARAYVLEPAGAPERATELGDLLARQGLEVFLSSGSEGVPSGGVVVPLDQPLGRLARALLERHAPMGEAFEAEQERRDSRREGDEIYDLTAWSLPLVWGVPMRSLSSPPPAGSLQRLVPGATRAARVSGDGRVAYLLPWTGPAAARALGSLLQQGVVAGVATRPFVLGGRRWERGTIVLRAAENDGRLRDRLAEASAAYGTEFVGAESGYVDEGIDLGSSRVHLVEAPAVALLWDVPTSATSAGHLRHALERDLGYAVTPVRVAALGAADLSRFDVLVMPDASEQGGGYAGAISEGAVRRLQAWVRDGGTLVAVGGGAEFLSAEKVGLLAARTEPRGGAAAAKPREGEPKPEAAKDGATPFDYQKHITPADEKPPSVPGAIVRVELDGEHLLASGVPGGSLDVIVNSRRIFSPLKLDQGTNVGVFAPAERLLQSGFMLKASREQLPRKGYLMVQEHGRGRVVAFAEDPAVRGFTIGSMLLLANAVFLGPAL